VPRARLTTKTLRLPSDLVQAAEVRAEEIGLNLSDIVEAALAEHLGLPRNQSFEVLAAVRDHLLARYPRRQGFPRDVTLTVFRHIQTDPGLQSLYRSAVVDPDGSLDETARDSLHRRIGKLVKQVLRARVVGRSLPLDPAVELIRSHALLEPTVAAQAPSAVPA